MSLFQSNTLQSNAIDYTDFFRVIFYIFIEVINYFENIADFPVSLVAINRAFVETGCTVDYKSPCFIVFIEASVGCAYTPLPTSLSDCFAAKRLLGHHLSSRLLGFSDYTAQEFWPLADYIIGYFVLVILSSVNPAE